LQFNNQKMFKMKKIILGVVFVIGIAAAVQAQPRAIGGRLGWGLEASYQHGFGSTNMLQADLGFWGFHGLAGVATYDWIWKINSWNYKGEWNWYAGVGGGVGFAFNSYGFFGVAGMVGVEYNFWFPLQLSIDYRPVIGPDFGRDHFGFNTGGFYSAALSVRYRF
jgi:hypothetical protein